MSDIEQAIEIEQLEPIDTSSTEATAEMPIATQEDETSAWLYFQKMTKLSWQMSLSYTFSLEMVALVYLLGQVNKDDDHLAAITLITTVINSLICIGVAPLLAMSQVVGKELGALEKAKQENFESQELLAIRHKRVAAVFGNGLRIALPRTIAVTLAMVFSECLLVNVLQQNAHVARITQDFVRPYAIAVPAVMTRVTADQVMFMFERTKPAMLIGFSNFIFGMALSMILAFGWLGSPKFGSSGILIGAILNEYLTAIGYCFYLAHSPRLQAFNFFNFRQSWQPYMQQLGDIRKLGRTITFSMLTETTMTTSISLFAGVVGVQPQAVLSTIMQFSLLSLLLQIAFGQTAAQEISREMGKDRFQHASLAGKMGLVSMLAYTVPPLLCFSAYPSMLAKIQGNHNQYFMDTLTYLAPIMFIGCILDSARFLLLQELRLLGDARISSGISSLFIAMGIVLSGTLSLNAKMGMYGIGIGYTSSATLASATLFYRWLSRIKPEAIEHIKHNPEQFFSMRAFLRKNFFGNSTPHLNTVTDEPGIAMTTIENPLRAALAKKHFEHHPATTNNLMV